MKSARVSSRTTNWSTAMLQRRIIVFFKFLGIISLGKGLINYPAGKEGMVSFKANSIIRIKSKSAGSDLSLWGIEVNGREGYAPKRLIKEEKILIGEKHLTFVVDVVKQVDLKAELPQSDLNSSEPLIETTTTQPLEVDNKKETVVNGPKEFNNDELLQSTKSVQSENIRVEGFKLHALDENLSGQAQSVTPTLNENILVEATKLNTLGDNYSENGKLAQAELSETPSVGGSEYDDGDDGEIGDYDDDDVEDGEQSQKVGVDNTAEKEKDTSLPDSLKSNEEAMQNLKDNAAVVESTSTERKDILIFNGSQNPVPKGSFDINNQTTKTLENTQVLNGSSEDKETVEGDNTDTDTLRNIKSKTSTEYTEMPNSLENRKKIEEDAFKNVNPIDEQHTNVPYEAEKTKPNEQIVSNDTNNEALLTTNAQENVVERYIPYESSLPDNKMNVGIGVSLEKVQSAASQTEKSSNEPPESAPPLKAPTPLAEANATQAPGKETGTYVVSESVPNQQVNTGYQFNVEPTVETENLHSVSRSSEDIQFDSQYLTATETQTPKPDEHDDNTNDPQFNTDTSNERLPVPLKPLSTENVQFDSQHLTSFETPQPDDKANEYFTGSQYNPYDYEESSNTPLPPQYDNNNNHNDELQTTVIPHYHSHAQQSTVYAPVDFESDVTTSNPAYISSPEEDLSNNQGSIERLEPLDNTKNVQKREDDPKSLDKKENKGLFATIMDTVNNILPKSKKSKNVGYDIENHHSELDKILYSNEESIEAKVQGNANVIFFYIFL